MDTEARDDWATALESGQYQQGYGQLVVKYPDGARSYCCLGVLCERQAERLGITVLEDRFDEEYIVLPHRVVRELGMSSANPVVRLTADEQAEAGLSIPEEGDEAETGSMLRDALYNALSTGRIYPADEAAPEDPGTISLAELNDHHVAPAVIAKLIRKYL